MSSTRHYGAAPRGEVHYLAKLDDETVRKIRRMRERKERLQKLLDERYSARAIAARFGISKSTVDKVLSYERWRHVR